MDCKSSSMFWWFATVICFVLNVSEAYVVERHWIVRRRADDLENVHNIQPQVFNEQGAASRSLPVITSMDIVSDIRLRYAITKVTSRVSNPVHFAQETTFHVILPETAFISGFLMEVDGKVYKAGLKEKEKAQAEYQAAVESGQSAAHVAARDANEFTVSVNLAASSKVTFNLTYEELLSRRRSIYEQAIHVNPGSLVPRLSLEVNIDEVLPIRDVKVIPQRSNDLSTSDDSKSVSEDLVKVIRTNDTRVTISYHPSKEDQLRKSKEGLQGQFVVQYDVDRTSVEKKGGEVHVVDGYFVHFFAPSSLPVLPKHIVFVLDTSGSMHGEKMEQTKQAMESILDQLRPDDVFSVVEFSSGVNVWDLTKEYKAPFTGYWGSQDEQPTTEGSILELFGKFDDIQAYQVTERSLKRAKEFVSRMQANGGTNINEAMLTALKNAQSLQSRIRLTPLIIFLTDGEPTVGETHLDAILRNMRKANSDNIVSIYTLAFGTGADFNFLTKVASQNKGFGRKIYEAADATLQLQGFFDEIASPLLTDVHFVYGNNTDVSDLTETKIPNWFRGSEAVIAGRVDPKSSTLSVAIDGTSAKGPYNSIEDFPIDIDSTSLTPPLISRLPLPKDSEKNETGKFSLEKIWAYLTIQELLKKRQVNDNQKELETINEKALNLSLKYGFVTPLTSLVVVKPNEEKSTADVRPADGFSHAAHTYGAPAPLFFSAPLAAASPQSSHAFRPQALGLTQRLPVSTFARPSVIAHDVYEEAEKESSTDAFDEFDTTVSDHSFNYFDPVKFISQLQHNETHVNMTSGNQTVCLSWKDELPDEGYQACTPSYSNVEGAVGLCKSIWKCDSITEDVVKASLVERDTVDPDNACIINNTYIGICCISVPIPAVTTEASIDTTTETSLETTTEISSESTTLMEDVF